MIEIIISFSIGYFLRDVIGIFVYKNYKLDEMNEWMKHQEEFKKDVEEHIESATKLFKKICKKINQI